MDTMTVLRVGFVVVLIWLLAWITGSSASVSLPGGYARVGKGKGCRNGRRPRKYYQVSSGLYGVDVATTAPQMQPAGEPYSTF